jgi:hypothetical protein
MIALALQDDESVNVYLLANSPDATALTLSGIGRVHPARPTLVASVWTNTLRDGKDVVVLKRDIEIKIYRDRDHFEAKAMALGIDSFGLTRREAQDGIAATVLSCLRRFQNLENPPPLAAGTLAQIESMLMNDNH